MDYKLLNELDAAIEECIRKFRNAKTGKEVKTFILEYEELMFKREQEFTRLLIGESRLAERPQENILSKERGGIGYGRNRKRN